MLLLSGVWLHALLDGCDQQQRHAHTLKSLHLELDNSTFRIWLLRISPHSDAFSDASQKGHVVKHVWENLAEAENLAESLGKSGPRAARAPIGFNPQNPQDGGSTLQVELTGNSYVLAFPTKTL